MNDAINADNFDPDKAITTIKRFITGQLLRSAMDGYVIGLSGGIDSAVVAALAVSAVGHEKVYALLMPYKTSTESSVVDALDIARKLNIEYKQIDISPMIDAYFDNPDDSIKVRIGNKMARERMSILFDFAHKLNRLVLGTSNRTEIALGYTTIFGDQACSINPIGELYKTEIRQIAKKLDIPDTIINKPPSADLWIGQTDEAEIGVTFSKLDSILKELIDNNNTSLGKLTKDGYSSADISRVVSLMNRTAYKRQSPPIAPIGRATIPENIHLGE